MSDTNLSKPVDAHLDIVSSDRVRELEHYLSQFPQTRLPPANLIHGGMCARTMFIPANTIVTGAQTNVDNICIVFGDVTATTSQGVIRLTGHNVFPADAGFKRAVLTHSDTYWTTIHRTELTELSDIEKEMTDEHERLQCKAPVTIGNVT